MRKAIAEENLINMEKTLRTCPKGHRYYKSTDCPTCPICEAEKNTGFFVKVGAPARRALLSIGVNTVQKLSHYSKKEILALHGIGKTSIPILKNVLDEHGLDFKK